jgi:hypothetical protein
MARLALDVSPLVTPKKLSVISSVLVPTSSTRVAKLLGVQEYYSADNPCLALRSN